LSHTFSPQKHNSWNNSLSSVSYITYRTDRIKLKNELQPSLRATPSKPLSCLNLAKRVTGIDSQLSITSSLAWDQITPPSKYHSGKEGRPIRNSHPGYKEPLMRKLSREKGKSYQNKNGGLVEWLKW
jgi:hypothetical protein